MPTRINFYSVNDEFGEFSNFSLYRIKLKKKSWPTSEHYFQAQKFKDNKDQHDELRALLVSTGDAMLVEHTESDDYWGDGGDGSGRNMLGRLLEDVR